MAPLRLAFEDLGDVPSTDEIFYLLRDYLQPDTTLTLDSTSRSILKLLPENDPSTGDIDVFGEVCIELAEQIPYYHPSQSKIVRLLDGLKHSSQLCQVEGVKGRGTDRFISYLSLGMSMRNALESQETEKRSQYVNFHAFAAKLQESCIFLPTDPTWALWAQRDAHEGRIKGDREILVMAAAQWILWYGQTFFKHLLFPGEIFDMRAWKPGPLYDGSNDEGLSLHRWRFWRDAYRTVAARDALDEKSFGQECRELAMRAAEIMDSLERNMTF